MSAGRNPGGIVGNVLLLLVLLAMLGVGWAYTSFSNRMIREGGAVYLPSDATLETVAHQINAMITTEFLLPGGENDPVQRTRTSAAAISLADLSLPDSARAAMETQLARLAEYVREQNLPGGVDDRGNTTSAWTDRTNTFDVDGRSWTTFTRTMGTLEALEFVVAVTPTDYVLDVLVPRGYQAFTRSSYMSLTYRRWLERGIVGAAFFPDDNTRDRIVLDTPELAPYIMDADDIHSVLGDAYLGSLGKTVVKGAPAGEYAALGERGIMGVLGGLWTVVLVSVIVMMSRIRRQARTIAASEGGRSSHG